MNCPIKAGLSLALALALVPALVPALAAELATKSAASTARSAAAAEPQLSEGVVQQVDKGAGKVTIRHGQIVNLGMEPMTMLFDVKEPSMLERLRTGQKIRFQVEIIKGAYTVLRVEPVE